MRTLGIDVGATYVKWVVLDLSDGPRTVADGSFETRADLGPTAALERLAELGREVAAANAPVDRAGIGMPGPLDLERGRTVFLGNMPGWEDVPIVEPLERLLGLPVGLINDARAFTLAELEAGAGRGCRTLVGFAIGTGIGGGVVIDGRLLLGLSSARSASSVTRPSSRTDCRAGAAATAASRPWPPPLRSPAPPEWRRRRRS